MNWTNDAPSLQMELLLFGKAVERGQILGSGMDQRGMGLDPSRAQPRFDNRRICLHGAGAAYYRTHRGGAQVTVSGS